MCTQSTLFQGKIIHPGGRFSQTCHEGSAVFECTNLQWIHMYALHTHVVIINYSPIAWSFKSIWNTSSRDAIFKKYFRGEICVQMEQPPLVLAWFSNLLINQL